MRYFLVFFILGCISTVGILGWRGDKSSRNPIEVFPDMDHQAKYSPQSRNAFWEDSRDDRPRVTGSVMRGYEWEVARVFSEDYTWEIGEKPALYTGRKPDGSYFEGYPLEVDLALMELGQEKYEIFCAVCHGSSGDGNGATKADGSEWMEGRGYFGNTPTYHTDLYRNYPEGQLYDVITNGYNTMYPYGDKLTVEERWAVVAYVRALQYARHAPLTDLPEKYKARLNP